MADSDKTLENLVNFSSQMGLIEISNINDDGFNLQLIVKNDNLKVRFLRDRGEFSIYFQFLKITSKREWYSLDIIAEILSDDTIWDTNYFNQLNYLKKNINLIYNLFINDDSIDDKYDIKYRKLFDW